ncbi:MAG: class I SAM-dependent methyltransferase [Candidatus Omnitrophica bacterium]|nr:class I SAM-dependent methyltransferase [Candidatus Omnitrophota bacterium]
MSAAWVPVVRFWKSVAARGFFNEFVQSGCELVGLEISPDLIEIARTRVTHPGAVFVEGDVEHMPFEDGFFDAVVGIRILHHLDLRAALPEVLRVPIDFLHPWTPAPLVPALEGLGRWVERVPGLREIAGSLQILAYKE